MTHEKRMEKLIADLQDVIKKHLYELDETANGIFDADEIMERMDAKKDKPCEPVIYPKRKGENSMKVIR